MPDQPFETPDTRLPDLAAELAAFNQHRRMLLRERPPHPDGEEALAPGGSWDA